jgi:hypothetical protein
VKEKPNIFELFFFEGERNNRTRVTLMKPTTALESEKT